MSITVEDYTPLSIVVRGDTKNIKDNLKALGGKWNPNLKVGGAGWIFSKSAKDAVLALISNGGVINHPVELKSDDKLQKILQIAMNQQEIIRNFNPRTSTYDKICVENMLRFDEIIKIISGV